MASAARAQFGTLPASRSLSRAAAAREAWAWGNPATSAVVARLPAPPARVRVICSIEVTEYLAAKGKRTADVWRHEHARPFALLVCPASKNESGRGVRLSRGIPRPGRALFKLGRALAFEGHTPEGERVRFSLERTGVVDLYGDDATSRMHLVRTPRAKVPPLWVLTNGSRYALTERGIVR